MSPHLRPRLHRVAGRVAADPSVRIAPTVILRIVDPGEGGRLREALDAPLARGILEPGQRDFAAGRVFAIGVALAAFGGVIAAPALAADDAPKSAIFAAIRAIG